MKNYKNLHGNGTQPRKALFAWASRTDGPYFLTIASVVMFAVLFTIFGKRDGDELNWLYLVIFCMPVGIHMESINLLRFRKLQCYHLTLAVRRRDMVFVRYVLATRIILITTAITFVMFVLGWLIRPVIFENGLIYAMLDVLLMLGVHIIVTSAAMVASFIKKGIYFMLVGIAKMIFVGAVFAFQMNLGFGISPWVLPFAVLAVSVPVFWGSYFVSVRLYEREDLCGQG
ncbi:MAG: ABC-2 transporter permease [Oscillospiraceae bacterium]|nr:ABC-2 transporter permease [Oscillospiraceae bacterium]